MLEYKIRPGSGNFKKKPAIFLLHGYGSNMDDLFSFAPHLPTSHNIIAFQAPLSLGFGSYGWYPIGIDNKGAITSELDAAWSAVDNIIKNIDLLSERYDLDSEDLSILGFSQGAILSWALGFYKPNKIRRIMPISGLLHESVNTENKPTFIAYATHGIEDNIIPIQKAREFIVPISNNNPDIHYKEFKDGHTISQENFSELLKWIEKTNL